MKNFDKKNVVEKVNFDQAEVLKKLAKSQSTKDRVKLFGKVMDTYGIDPIISLIPKIGDGGVSLVASAYLLYEGKKMGLGFVNMLKIVGYQSADFVVGVVPLLGDIADFFFKANKRSATIFEKHFEKLKKEALEKGVSSQQIAEVENKNKKFIEALNKNLYSQKSNKTI